MTNVSLLRGKIAENYMTQTTVAEQMGMSRSTFYRKMKAGGKGFTVGEIRNLTKILSLTNEDVMRIFFSLKVA